MILDATAGNRAIWQHKNCDKIVYMDLEKKLERKPSIFADNRHCPFKDNIFHTIFFDPPYDYGNIHPFYMFPNKEEIRSPKNLT